LCRLPTRAGALDARCPMTATAIYAFATLAMALVVVALAVAVNKRAAESPPKPLDLNDH
jgi:hypothetical protein